MDGVASCAEAGPAGRCRLGRSHRHRRSRWFLGSDPGVSSGRGVPAGAGAGIPDRDGRPELDAVSGRPPRWPPGAVEPGVFRRYDHLPRMVFADLDRTCGG